jgi:hypothetical protein
MPCVRGQKTEDRNQTEWGLTSVFCLLSSISVPASRLIVEEIDAETDQHQGPQSTYPEYAG